MSRHSQCGEEVRGPPQVYYHTLTNAATALLALRLDQIDI